MRSIDSGGYRRIEDGNLFFTLTFYPRRVDQMSIQAAFRPDEESAIARGEPPPPPLQPTNDELQRRLAGELDHARAMLEQMGDELAADMGVVMRHSVALQSVDIVGQMVGHIANVIRALDPEAAVERIGMCDLKDRLTRDR